MFDYLGQQILVLTTIWWWQKLGKDLQLKNKAHMFHVESFDLKNLNEVEGKSNIWKIWTQRWNLTVTGKLLERISKF
jgi:hypothetical protein